MQQPRCLSRVAAGSNRVVAWLVVRRWLSCLILSSLFFGCTQWVGEEKCEFCLRPLQEKTRYRIHLQNGETKQVCCPRCGLHFQAGRSDVAGAEVTDYESGQVLPAEEATFVENSSVMLCCKTPMQRDRNGGQFELSWDRCMPSLIAFQSPNEAERFRQRNGGTVKSYALMMLESQPESPGSEHD